MTTPTNADLLDIWIESKTQYKGTGYATDLDAVAAVKRAVIEALAEEAREAAISNGQGDINADVADWLRSHLESGGPPMGQGPGGDVADPDIPGYSYVGVSTAHDGLPVYQKDVDSSLWIKTEGEMIPYSMTFDHTNGLGRVKE